MNVGSMSITRYDGSNRIFNGKLVSHTGNCNVFCANKNYSKVFVMYELK